MYVNVYAHRLQGTGQGQRTILVSSLPFWPVWDGVSVIPCCVLQTGWPAGFGGYFGLCLPLPTGDLEIQEYATYPALLGWVLGIWPPVFMLVGRPLTQLVFPQPCLFRGLVCKCIVIVCSQLCRDLNENDPPRYLTSWSSFVAPSWEVEQAQPCWRHWRASCSLSLIYWLCLYLKMGALASCSAALAWRPSFRGGLLSLCTPK